MRLRPFVLTTLMLLFWGAAGCGGDSSSDEAYYRGSIELRDRAPLLTSFRLRLDEKHLSGSGEIHQSGSAPRTGNITGEVLGQDDDDLKRLQFTFADPSGSGYQFSAILTERQIYGTVNASQNQKLKDPPLFAMTIQRDYNATSARANNLHIRHALADIGVLPYAFAAAAESPDIIIAGDSPVANPTTSLGSDSYENDFAKGSLIPGVPNYIYIRAKNFGSKAAIGRVFLYYLPASLVLHPDKWKYNKIKTASGAEFVNLQAAAGNTAVGEEPFVFIPPGLSNFSLIAGLETDKLPSEIPSNLNEPENYAQWIEAAPFAYRTVALVDSSTPVISTTFPLEGFASGEKSYQINISASRLIGASVALTASTPLPDGTTLQLPSTLITTDDFSVGIPVSLPHSYQSLITVSLYTNGLRIPLDAKLSLSQYLSLSEQNQLQPHKLYLLGQGSLRFR